MAVRPHGGARAADGRARSLARIALLAAALPLAGCAAAPAKMQDPEIRVERIRLVAFASNDARLELTLAVSNPNTLPVRLDAIDATLSLEAQKVADVALPQPVVLGALGPTAVVLDVRANPESVLRVVAQAVARGASSIRYELAGVAVDGTGGRWPFARQGTIGRAELEGRRP